jgi:hypothetical protein
MIAQKARQDKNAKGGALVETTLEEQQAAAAAQEAFDAEHKTDAHADLSFVQQHRDAVIAVCSIAGYIMLGRLYYGWLILDWTGEQVCYFALATITTIGYGKY